MTPYQLAAFKLPCCGPDDFNRPGTSHWERGFRVTMIVDAVPESAGVAESWPAWMVLVVLDGELSAPHRRDKGKAHPARALGNWGALKERQALHIVRRELAGVGYPETETLVDKQQAIRNWRAWSLSNPNVQPPVGVYGRRKMTQDEAEECFRDRREVLARLNPTYALLNQVTA